MNARSRKTLFRPPPSLLHPSDSSSYRNRPIDNLLGFFAFVLPKLASARRSAGAPPSLSFTRCSVGAPPSLRLADFVNADCWMVFLKDIVPAATDTISARFIMLEKGNAGQREGKESTCLALVADETASVHFQLWGDECGTFDPGDIVWLTNGIFSYHRGNLVLRAGKRGKAEKLGNFCMLFVESPNMSEIKWAPSPENPRLLLQEAVLSPHSRYFPPLP